MVLKKGFWVAGATAALLLAGAGTAQATPTAVGPLLPNTGPAAGGTRVVVEVPQGPTWVSVETGRSHGLGLATDGLLYTWGNDSQAGEANLSPQRITTPEGVKFTQIAVGTVGNAAIAEDGTVYVWDAFSGNGTNDTADVPTAVELPGGVTAVQVGVGRNYVSVLAEDGLIYGWGVNSEGVLGTGTTRASYTPVAATMPAGVTKFAKISAGGEHMLALTDEGALYGWGNGMYGALSTDGSVAFQLTPALLVSDHVPAGTKVVNISASLGDGSGTSLITKEDGWGAGTGRHSYGQAGVENRTSEVYGFTRATPTLPQFAAELVGSNEFSAALSSEGFLYVWGDSPATRYDESYRPYEPASARLPEGLPKLHDLRAGMDSITAMGDDGEAYLWGTNPGGETSGLPVALDTPEAVVTGVDFGGEAATDIEQIDATHWEVTAPAHTPAQVDVTTEWAVGGAAQKPIVNETYGYVGAPTLAELKDVKVRLGETAKFELSLTGFPNPTVEWQVDMPGDANVSRAAVRGAENWQPVSIDKAASVAADGLSMNVIANKAHDGIRFRAVVTNSEGSATTNAATLVLDTSDENGGNGGNGNGGNGNGNGTDGGSTGGGSGTNGASSNGGAAGTGSVTNAAANNGGSLARTGGAEMLWLVLGGAAIAAAGGTVLVARRRRA
ncbi:LPXTG cell wall anchor domain-containing protein [Leucobacter sp. cx-328]|uniref:LPXTG cell wall anchor domain-containing protein n=1 Tax=unclassified Leucobacter TaxID=2621730 RepID=UPI00165D9B6C|nr:MULTISPECIES: LPXTG cell wall anchor domain-containing protein [unclassified Leucobacter]MBC9945116.1 LPXTG cell wall anchor domain-containing protein [Leucobacter sp. cx-328]